FISKGLSPDSPINAPDAFSRLDESDDALFYRTDRFVSHLDRTALATVEHVIGTLINMEEPVILDLMAGWDSHIPRSLPPGKVVGLGLNRNELETNPSVNEVVIHDLNQDPVLPFPDKTFDAVINTVSIDYMTRAVDVFREVHRTLKPGGIFLVVFSSRMFPGKAVKVWRDADEGERLILVHEFFQAVEGFEPPREFVSRGRPRPEDDKYAGTATESDPVFAVYARKEGGDPGGAVPRVTPLPYGERSAPEEIERRKALIKDTMACPYCGEGLLKWMVPDNPFCQTWDNDYMYICFNDSCPYYVRGWDHMDKEGNRGMSYRLMYNPQKDRCMPVPVPSPKALKDGIVAEG
ncbi:MAG: class I SAM-dependent methyltransferase, partial [Thermodesulfobacteriota bacterium]